MNETEITIILPTSAAKEIFFDGWLHGFEPSTWLKNKIIGKLTNRPERREPSRRADQPTPEQQAELARQLAAAGTPAELADAAAAPIRLPGYDPSFTPDPENFGTIS